MNDDRSTPTATTRRGKMFAVALAGAGLLLLTGTGAALATTATASLSDAATPSATAPAAESAVEPATPAPAPESSENAAVDSDITAVDAAPATPGMWVAREPESYATRSETPRRSVEGISIPGLGTSAPIYNIYSDLTDIPYPADTAEDLAEWESWTEMQYTVGRCMAEKGFSYFWTYGWERGAGEENGIWGEIGMWTDPSDEAALALDGTNMTDTGPYDWTRAGCWGYAAEVLGNTH